jgi:hypothetical protein
LEAYPIDSLQNLPAGIGVCADDIVAGRLRRNLSGYNLRAYFNNMKKRIYDRIRRNIILRHFGGNPAFAPEED